MTDFSSQQIKIPKLLCDHRDDFLPLKSQYAEDNPYRDLSNVALIRYITDKLPSEFSEQLKQLTESGDRGKRKITHAVIDEDLTIGYNFPSSRRSMLEDGTSPLPQRIPFKSTPVRRYDKLKSYKFTEDTVSFVHQQVPLVASLVCLLCPPESLSNVLDFMASDDAIVDTKEEPKEDPKASFVQTIGAPVKPKIRELKRTLSNNDDSKLAVTHSAVPRSACLWEETFDKLLLLFVDGTPLKYFLTCRLGCFKSILPWDRLIQEPLKEEDSVGEMDDPAINLRALAVLPGQCLELSHACMFVLRKLLRKGLLQESLKFLNTEPVINNRESVQSVADIVLSSCFVSEATTREKTSDESEIGLNPLVLIYQLSDIELACRLVLPYLEVWPVNVCVKLLCWIHYHLPTSSSFVATINEHLYRLNIYLRVIETVEAPDPNTLQPRPSPWNHWSQLVYDSKERSGYVLANLLKNKAFGLAREWALVHRHVDKITEVFNYYDLVGLLWLRRVWSFFVIVIIVIIIVIVIVIAN